MEHHSYTPLPLHGHPHTTWYHQIFRTLEGRGWGLRLAQENGAKAGTLLHEYLGEVIDIDECKERLGMAEKQDFYFASLDGNLVLDAGKRAELIFMSYVLIYWVQWNMTSVYELL